MGEPSGVGGLLLSALADPPRLAGLDGPGWTRLLAVARSEKLLAVLESRCADAQILCALPRPVRAVLADAAIAVDHRQTRARWEIGRVGGTLAPYSGPRLLLKGSAYLMAGLRPARGRDPGDLDMLIPHARLAQAEALLHGDGWRFAKSDPYDDHYYRAWMHELPPMVHETRGGELDIHHNILPRVSRWRADADALIAQSVAIGGGWSRLCDADLVLHSIAHLFADGPFETALRNLWDIHCLLDLIDAQGDAGWSALLARARRHRLEQPLGYALRACGRWLNRAIPDHALQVTRQRNLGARFAEALFDARLGDAGLRPATRKGVAARLLLMLRGHWIKMPPLMLARHAMVKLRRRPGGAAGA